MIGKSFEFNGTTISKTTWDFRVGLDVVQWKQLDVTDEAQNVQWYHWVKLSPTFARGRRITLEGIIVADDHEKSSMAIDYLEELFALQWVPSQVNLMPFIVTDEQDRQWKINCKIKEPLSIDISDDDWREGTNRRWRVVLQSEDPRYYSVDEYGETGAEWHFGGVKFPVKFWVKFDEYFNEIQVNAQSQIEAPLIFTLTATGDIDAPLLIKNLTDGTFFWLDIDAVAWDVIVVDSNTYKVTKNWVNIKASRIEWSTWPRSKWVTTFSIFDNDWGLFESDFDVDIKWRNILL